MRILGEVRVVRVWCHVTNVENARGVFIVFFLAKAKVKKLGYLFFIRQWGRQ